MRRMLWVGVVLLLPMLSACRTTLEPLRRADTQTYVGTQQCDVFDYSNATDVPEGSSNLGWVSVRKDEGEDDEATFIRLRKRICEMGGNALSQPAWVRETDEVEPTTLRANVWVLP